MKYYLEKYMYTTQRMKNISKNVSICYKFQVML